MTVIVALILFPFVLGLLLCTIIWAANKMIKKMVIEKHRALEEITTTGRVPRNWSRPFEKRLSLLSQDEPQNEQRIAVLQARANQRYLKNLDRLARYVKTSRLVEGEGTRRMLLSQLAKTRADWQSGDYGSSERDEREA